MSIDVQNLLNHGFMCTEMDMFQCFAAKMISIEAFLLRINEHAKLPDQPYKRSHYSWTMFFQKKGTFLKSCLKKESFQHDWAPLCIRACVDADKVLRAEMDKAEYCATPFFQDQLQTLRCLTKIVCFQNEMYRDVKLHATANQLQTLACQMVQTMQAALLPEYQKSSGIRVDWNIDLYSKTLGVFLNSLKDLSKRTDSVDKRIFVMDHILECAQH